MSKFTFICEDEPMPFADVIVTKKTFEFNADHLDGVIGEFETFLRGCGFDFEGYLEIINDEKSYIFNKKDFNKRGELDLEAQESYEDLDLYTESIFDKK